MKNVLELFEHTVEKFPNKVGFTDENRCSTFSETMEKSKKIGTSLLQYGNRKAVAILIDKTVTVLTVCWVHFMPEIFILLWMFIHLRIEL